jgi:GAF domain-containing protein
VAAEISTALVNVPAAGLDGAISDALQKLEVLYSADRSYVFRFSGDLATMSNTHEWCAPNIESHLDVIQDFSTKRMPRFMVRFMGRLQRGLPTHVTDVDAMSSEAAAEQQELRKLGIQSLICLPMARRKELLGFFGFDSVTGTWREDEISFLRVVADAFAEAFLRQRDQVALRRVNATLEQRVADRTERRRGPSRSRGVRRPDRPAARSTGWWCRFRRGVPLQSSKSLWRFGGWPRKAESQAWLRPVRSECPSMRERNFLADGEAEARAVIAPMRAAPEA